MGIRLQLNEMNGDWEKEGSTANQQYLVCWGMGNTRRTKPELTLTKKSVDEGDIFSR